MYSITIVYLYNEDHNTCWIETDSFDDVLKKIREMFNQKYGDYGPDDVTSIDVYKCEEEFRND